MENNGQPHSRPPLYHQSSQPAYSEPSSSSWPPKHEQQQTQMSQPRESSTAHDDPMPSTSDFVKKLYKMLEDPSFQSVVSWGPQGDCFVVKDMNEFTKSILPRMFKHSNFASFVRQLNKYDFHKVKNTDDSQFGEHSWTFRHPDFHADRRDALENIKRKVPAQRKAAQIDQLQFEVRRLKEEGDDLRVRLRTLERNYENVLVEMVGFQRGIAQQDNLMQSLISCFLGNENGGYDMSSSTMDIGRASLMQMSELSRRWMPSAGVASWNGTDSTVDQSQQPQASSSSSSTGMSAGFSRAEALGKIEEMYRARINSMSLTGVPSTAQWSPQQPQRQDGLSPSDSPEASATTATATSYPSRSQPTPLQPEPQARPLSSAAFWDGFGLDENASSKALAHEGLQVYTVGQLMPRNISDSWNFDSDASAAAGAGGGVGIGGSGNGNSGGYPTGSSIPSTSSISDSFERGGDRKEVALSSTSPTTSANATTTYPSASLSPSPTRKPKSSSPSSPKTSKLRVRRTTVVPGWAVAPRVLLVDDDIVSRKLGSKFLQVSGCTIDVAVDGMGAVTKMNLEKYDLVLMDIVMPKMDGVSATSMIRQFDHLTPIISMTSNAKPNEIMTYYSSGMNDILPKPFTQTGLFEMLEKHLMHLKAIQRLNKLPRSIEQGQAQGLDDETRVVNPLSGMGLTDEQYNMILQNVVNGESFMNGIDGSSAPASAEAGPSSSSPSSTGNGGMGMRFLLSGMNVGVGDMNPSVPLGGGGTGGEKRRYEESALGGPLSSGRDKRSRFEVVD
ncbi:Transcription factor prr1 [Leucoagaricus sp. SymC.cos]|nr:Transcription factor prr1 [Leucoagaricus sp. SymC.cos]